MRALAARRKCVREGKLTDEPRTFLQMQSEANRLAGTLGTAMPLLVCAPLKLSSGPKPRTLAGTLCKACGHDGRFDPPTGVICLHHCAPVQRGGTPHAIQRPPHAPASLLTLAVEACMRPPRRWPSAGLSLAGALIWLLCAHRFTLRSRLAGGAGSTGKGGSLGVGGAPQRANLKPEAKLELFRNGRLFHCSDPNCKNTGDPSKGKGQCGSTRSHKTNVAFDKSNPVKSETDIDNW